MKQLLQGHLGRFLLCLGLVLSASAHAEWEHSDTALAWQTNGRTLWRFSYDPARGKPFFDPLTIGDTALTLFRPEDHPWHYGLWFSWQYINGANYWEEDRATGRAEGKTHWSSPQIETRPDGSATVRLDVTYTHPSGRVDLTEQRELQISAPAANGSYAIEWIARFTAGSEGAFLDRTPMPGEPNGQVNGGYAGLSLRLAAAPLKMTVVTPDGPVASFASDRARPAAPAVAANLKNGKRDVGAVAVLSDPANIDAQAPWYVINAEKGMRFICAAVLAPQPRRLAAGEQWTLRYRVVVQSQPWTPDTLRAVVLQWQAAARKPVASSAPLSSPNGRMQVAFALTNAGEPRYSVLHNDRTVIEESRLGLKRDDADFTQGLQLIETSPVETVRDEYELLTSKRRFNKYEARRQVYRLRLPQGQRLDVEFQVSNDGVAFRYVFPEQDSRLRAIFSEASSFRFPAQTKAWLQPIAVAKSGWSATNPSYEETYEKNIDVGTPSSTGAGWVYPALFRTGDTWLLLSETGLTRNYCGTRLQSRWRSAEYTVGFPDPQEHFRNGPVAPQSTLPWTTPWRLIAVGDLASIVESSLGTDLAQPAPTALARQGPGKAAWSWPLLGDNETNFDTQKRFIDYAAEMGWAYTLVDSMWDRQIGYERLQELVNYARTKNVRILLWYNSAGDWNTTPLTPRDLMLTRESRTREFTKLKRMGVAGVKVDFFGGDGQSMIQYYQDILDDAARFGLLVNFHGATLPRGWHRSYPNLMTVEAVRGLEFVTFEQKNAEDEPTHAAMLPFTRNVFDPMDFTPVVLDRINNIERRTSSAFELALAVLFTSGIQHYAEIPEGMMRAPSYVRDFMKSVPSIWDDVSFLAGEPGKYVVLARRNGKQWYVAGINGERAPREVILDLAELGSAKSGTAITDGAGGNLSFRQLRVELDEQRRAGLTMQGRGGFVMVLD